MAITKDPEAASKVGDIISVVAVETGLAILAVIGRIVIKTRMTKARLWWDDYLMMIALALAIFHGGAVVGQIPYGFGHHIEDLAPEVNVWGAVRLFYLCQISYFAMIGVIKMSILVFYLRLSHTLRPAVFALMAFVTCTHVACTLVAIFQCTPIAFDWDESLHGRCVNRTAFYYSNAALNIVSDIIIYILPMPMLWNVQISKQKRIGLIFVFALGGFVVITGILRLESLRLANITKDPTWDNVGSALWSETEFNVGIVCGCLPSMKPLFMAILGVKNKFTSKGSSAASTNPTSGTLGTQSDIKSPMTPNYEAKIMGSGHHGPVVTEADVELGSREQLVDYEGGIVKTTNVIVTTSQLLYRE